MKVTGNSPPLNTGGTDEAKATKSVDTDKPKFDALVNAPAAAPAPAGGASVARTSSNKLTGDIGQALTKGEITPEVAVDKVVSRILDKQVGGTHAGPMRNQVETALRDALETDPVLTAKVKSLSD